MIKTVAKVLLPIVVLSVFLTSMAYADDFSHFVLRIDDITGGYTGNAVIITATDLTTDGINGNLAPLGLAPQVIEWSGSIDNGQYLFNVIGAFSDPEGPNGATLSLSAFVQNMNPNSAGQILLTLEDIGYSQTTPPIATFTGAVAGLAEAGLPIDEFNAQVSQYANSPNVVTTGASTVAFQTWVNTADAAIAYPPDGQYIGGVNLADGTTPLVPATVAIPAGGTPAFSGPNADPQGNNANFAQAVAGVNTGAAYSIQSQALLTLDAGGLAAFTLTGNVTPTSPKSDGNVPEPTSLLLIGSCLIGLGVLRVRHGSLL